MTQTLFSAGLSNPDEKVLKITVKGVPLSVDDGEVIKILKKFNLSFTSDLKYEKIRHPETHKMTGILNYNRFIYVKALPQGTFFTSFKQLCRSEMFHISLSATL